MVGNALVGCLAGMLSGFGIGGGSLLILWLTQVSGLGQWEAAGLNLVYFLCCAPMALWGHLKQKLVQPKAVLWCMAAGIPMAVTAAVFAAQIEVVWLRRAFGIVLLYVGSKEVFCTAAKPKKQE